MKINLSFIFIISGGIPAEIGNLTRLEMLNIDHASLTGDIPYSIFNISSLTMLSLSFNSLSGSIPTFDNLPQLAELYLTSNKLTGIQFHNIVRSIFLSAYKCIYKEFFLLG